MRLVFGVSVILAFACYAPGQTYTIQTIAGGALPVNIAGSNASLSTVNGVAVDAAGNSYIVLQSYNVVLRVDATTGMLTLAAGNGTPGYSGDNGPAASAQLAFPVGVALDPAGNLYIADSYNNCIRKVSGGIITTVAGGGNHSGDNIPATSAVLNGPTGVAVDSSGNIYITDPGNSRVWKVSGGTITAVAGNGTYGYNGDNIPATSAQINWQAGVAVDASGNLYIAELANNRVRKVSAGMITTVAGTGPAGYNGDNIPAATAQLSGPSGVAVDAAGNVYIADAGNNRIRKIAGGAITTVAGNAGFAYGGDTVPATSTSLYGPFAVAVDPAGNLYIADTYNYRLRKVSGGMIATLAGGGEPLGLSGPASSAQLDYPNAVAVDPSGNVFIADILQSRIFEVTNGVIGAAVGNGTDGYSGDSGPAASAELGSPYGIAEDPAGNLYITDFINECIREVSKGMITTVAGNGASAGSGDNGPAISAGLSGPLGVAADASGDFYITAVGSNTIRKVTNGIITTVAGNGTQGFGGDGGPATRAELFQPEGVAVDSTGNIYIADTNNNRVRKVAGGVITTVAGGGSGLGDGGPATSAFVQPSGVAVDSSRNLYISDTKRLRKVSGGVITTIAGTGAQLTSIGNAAAQCTAPSSVAVGINNNVYFSDVTSHRVCMLTPSSPPCAYSVSPAAFTPDSSGGNLTVNIQATSGCAWAVEGLPDWITASSGPVSSGPAALTLQVAAGGGGARAATLSIAGLSIQVTQMGSGPDPVLNSGGVVNAASSAGAVAAGGIATAYGDLLLTSSMTGGSSPLLTNLLGLSLQFGDTAQAPLFFASPVQVNFQVPWELAGQTQTTVTAMLNGQISSAQMLSLAPFAPGIFTTNSQGTGQGAILDSNYKLVDSSNPAALGSTYIMIYCTGLGQVTNQPATGYPALSSPLSQTTVTPTVTIGGVAASVPFSGLAPGFVGLYQVNALVPAGLPANNATPVVISFGDVSSNTATIAVQ